jgi:hypothetical protein
MRLAYVQCAPPHALAALELPDDPDKFDAEYKRRWTKWSLDREALQGRAHRMPPGTVAYPIALYRVEPDLWLLEARDTAAPSAFGPYRESILSAIEQDKARGGPVLRYFQLTQQAAIRYILNDGYPLPDGIPLTQPAPRPTGGSDRDPDRADQTGGPTEGDPAPAADGHADSRSAWPDALLDTTLSKIQKAPLQQKIVATLWRQPNREATREAIAKEVYKARDAELHHHLENLGKQLTRTLRNLDANKCPLRIIPVADRLRLVRADSHE